LVSEKSRPLRCSYLQKDYKVVKTLSCLSQTCKGIGYTQYRMAKKKNAETKAMSKVNTQGTKHLFSAITGVFLHSGGHGARNSFISYSKCWPISKTNIRTAKERKNKINKKFKRNKRRQIIKVKVSLISLLISYSFF